MAKQGNTYDKHAQSAPRHGRHASSAPAASASEDSIFNTQDIAVRSRHAAPAQPEQAQPASNLDFGGLDEYAYGAPVEEPANTYSYDAVNLAQDSGESILPDNLRSRNKVPRAIAGGILRVIGIFILLCFVIGLGCCIGLVYLLDVNPLVLFAIK